MTFVALGVDNNTTWMNSVTVIHTVEVSKMEKETQCLCCGSPDLHFFRTNDFQKDESFKCQTCKGAYNLESKEWMIAPESWAIDSYGEWSLEVAIQEGLEISDTEVG